MVAGGLGSEDGVGLVDQQGGRVGRVGADRPVDRRRRGVGGEQRLVAERLDQVEQPGLAAALLGGLDHQPGRGVPGRHGVGGGDPQHDRGGGGVGRQHDVPAEGGGDLVQQLGAVVELSRFGALAWAVHAVALPMRGSAAPRLRPLVMVASASAAVKAPSRMCRVQASRSRSRAVGSSS